MSSITSKSSKMGTVSKTKAQKPKTLSRPKKSSGGSSTTAAAGTSVPVILLNEKGLGIGHWCLPLATLLATLGFYRDAESGDVVKLTKNNDGRIQCCPMDAKALRADLPNHVQFVREGTGGERKFVALTSAQSNCFLAHRSVAQLPALRGVTKTPPIVKQSGKVKWLGPGYSDAEQVYYDGDLVAALRTRKHLRGLFEHFPFADDGSFANLLGVLIGAFVYPAVRPPLLVIAGDSQGRGKTTLAGVLQVLIDDADPTSIHYGSDDELRKHLSAYVKGARRTVVVDNITTRGNGRAFKSDLIAALATSKVAEFRLLGHSKLLTRENNFLIVMTCNDMGIHADLASRAVFVHLASNKAGDELFVNAYDPVAYATAYRTQILGEVYSLIENGPKGASKKPSGGPKKAFRDPVFAQRVSDILTANRITGFLANRDSNMVEREPKVTELFSLAPRLTDWQQPYGICVGIADAIQAGEAVPALEEFAMSSTQANTDSGKNCVKTRGLATVLKRGQGKVMHTESGKAYRLDHKKPQNRSMWRFEEVDMPKPKPMTGPADLAKMPAPPPKP